MVIITESNRWRTLREPSQSQPRMQLSRPRPVTSPKNRSSLPDILPHRRRKKSKKPMGHSKAYVNGSARFLKFAKTAGHRHPQAVQAPRVPALTNGLRQNPPSAQLAALMVAENIKARMSSLHVADVN